MNSPLFSILIPTWNNLSYLKLAVESIRKNSTYTHQIIVHANEGNDGTLQWLEEEGIEHTHSDTNIGVCLAMNSMRPLVRTDYIFYMNDDMVLLPGWDKALWREIEKLPDHRFFLSSTMIQPHNHLDVGILADYGDCVENFQEERLLRECESLAKPNWNGATWTPNLVHRDIWDLVGGFSIEYTPGMYSDPDFTAKLWFAGVRTMIGVGDSLAYHFETKTTGRITKNNGAAQFLMKWGIPNSLFRKKISKLGDTAPQGEARKAHVSKADLFKSKLKAAWKAMTSKIGVDPKFWE